MKYSAEMIDNIKRDYSDKSISRQEICEKYGISSIRYLAQLMHRKGGFRGGKHDRRQPVLQHLLLYAPLPQLLLSEYAS